MKRVFGLALALLVLASQLSGCFTALRVVNDWDTGVELYTAAERDSSNCTLEIFTSNQKMTGALMIVGAFTSSNEALAETWARGQGASDQLAAQQQQYAQAAVPNDQGHVDLDALQDQGLTPNALGGGLTTVFDVMVDVTYQAQATTNDPTVFIAAMDTVNEAMNAVSARCGDYNTSAAAYNAWVHSVEPAVVTEVARRLGVDYLPENLEGFAPTFANPLLPTPAP